MAVYTFPTDDQWQEIALRLGYDEIRPKPEPRGTNDSKYQVLLVKDGVRARAMLNIIETPDVHVNGIAPEQAQCLPMLFNHMVSKGIISDNSDRRVKSGVPRPLLFDEKDPLILMEFPSHEQGAEDELVTKVIYVVPFIQGHCPNGIDNVPQDETTARKLGAAHAAWHIAAEGFPDAEKLVSSFPVEKWGHYADALAKNPKAEARLGADTLAELIQAVKYITSHWQEKTEGLPDILINGDSWPDNAIISDNGTVTVIDNGAASYGKNTDIAMGLNSAAMKSRGEAFRFIGQVSANRFAFCHAAAMWSDAKPVKKVAAAYLQGYNSVKPLSEKEKRTFEFMAQVATIRFALARAVIIANAPEGAEVATRPPAALLEHYKYWHKAEQQGGGTADKLLRSRRSAASRVRNLLDFGEMP